MTTMIKSARSGEPSVAENLDGFNAAKKHAQDIRLEKERKLEELKLKVKKLREERIIRHAARIQTINKMNTQKYGDLSLVLGITNQNNGKHGNLNLPTPKKPINETKKSSIPALSDSSRTSSILPRVASKKNETALSQKSFDSRSSVPSANFPRSKLLKSASYHVPNEVNGKSKLPAKNTKINIPNSPNKALSKPSSNKSFNISTIERLSKPKSISQPKLNDLHLNNKKEKNNIISVSTTTMTQPKIQNKRWTMASIDRLSKPKTVVKQIPVNHLQNGVAVAIKPHRKSMFVGHLSSTQNKAPVKTRKSEIPTLRRSLSTVHFKRLGVDAAKKCLTRTLSMGNIKNKEIEEIAGDIFPPKEYILPVESERKKSVKFLTPLRKEYSPIVFLHTPKLSELTGRLNDYLHKRGKSLSNYRHLKCFGSHAVKPTLKPKSDILLPSVDDENKENEDITDDESFNENMTGNVKDVAAKWRKENFQHSDTALPLDQCCTPEGIVDSADFTQLCSDVSSNIPVAVGALHELRNLITDGYSWQHCAEWLTLITKHVGANIKNTADYWECRSALEEKRGDFPRAVGCFKNAITQGVEPSQIENSLDALLVKFMELKLDPNDAKGVSENDSKLVEVKNVFKSTLIQFAIQEKNIEELNDNTVTVKSKYVATPVRRCSRLSKVHENGQDDLLSLKNVNNINSKKPLSPKNLSNSNEKPSEIKSTPMKTPLKQSAKKSSVRKHIVQLCSSLRNVDDKIKQDLIFVPNKALNFGDC